MALVAPFPELDELLAAIGEVEGRVSDMDASEGARVTFRFASVGNIKCAVVFQLKHLSNILPGSQALMDANVGGLCEHPANE